MATLAWSLLDLWSAAAPASLPTQYGQGYLRYNAVMYDELSEDYDRFVNWPSRLAGEMPWLETQLASVGVREVLDAACGTGQHVLALAQRGYQVSGADLSQAMITQARANAASAGQAVEFVVAGFGGLAPVFGHSKFKALLCLGNSLPHVLSTQELSSALADFSACLRPGGLLVLQNRNFDAILSRRERWMEPQGFRQAEQEWLFVRFYDFDLDGLITFNMLTLQRTGGAWQQRLSSTRLRPLLQAELAKALAAEGFGEVVFHGNMAGAAFDPQSSGNLVVTARRC